MKQLIIFSFFSLFYITTEAQYKNFTAIQSDTNSFNKTNLASMDDKKTVDIEAVTLLLTERNNTSAEEKQTVATKYKKPKKNYIIRSSLLVDAVQVNNFSNDNKVRSPIYSKGEKERQTPRAQHISVNETAVPINK